MIILCSKEIERPEEIENQNEIFEHYNNSKCFSYHLNSNGSSYWMNSYDIERLPGRKLLNDKMLFFVTDNDIEENKRIAPWYWTENSPFRISRYDDKTVRAFVGIYKITEGHFAFNPSGAEDIYLMYYILYKMLQHKIDYKLLVPGNLTVLASRIHYDPDFGNIYCSSSEGFKWNRSLKLNVYNGGKRFVDEYTDGGYQNYRGFTANMAYGDDWFKKVLGDNFRNFDINNFINAVKVIDELRAIDENGKLNPRCIFFQKGIFLSNFGYDWLCNQDIKFKIEDFWICLLNMMCVRGSYLMYNYRNGAHIDSGDPRQDGSRGHSKGTEPCIFDYEKYLKEKNDLRVRYIWDNRSENNTYYTWKYASDDNDWSSNMFFNFKKKGDYIFLLCAGIGYVRRDDRVYDWEKISKWKINNSINKIEGNSRFKKIMLYVVLLSSFVVLGLCIKEYFKETEAPSKSEISANSIDSNKVNEQSEKSEISVDLIDSDEVIEN